MATKLYINRQAVRYDNEIPEKHFLGSGSGTDKEVHWIDLFGVIQAALTDDTISGDEIESFTYDGSILTITMTDGDTFLVNLTTTELTTGSSMTIGATVYPVGTSLQVILNALNQSKVKVSANDTTANFLFSKLIPGIGITLAEQNDGANETILISAPGGGGGGSGFTWQQPLPGVYLYGVGAITAIFVSGELLITIPLNGGIAHGHIVVNNVDADYAVPAAGVVNGFKLNIDNTANGMPIGISPQFFHRTNASAVDSVNYVQKNPAINNTVIKDDYSVAGLNNWIFNDIDGNTPKVGGFIEF